MQDIGFRVARDTATTASRAGQAAPVTTADKPGSWPTYTPWPPVSTPGLQFRVREKDAMPQVLIPAGEFLMGSTPAEIARAADAVAQLKSDMSPAALRGMALGEGPRKRVRLLAYWMDLHEVTVAQFCAFLNASQPGDADRRSWVGLRGQTAAAWADRPSDFELRDGRYQPAAGHELFPARFVSWLGAKAYASWVGQALPSEAQWERAAKGGNDDARFAWGESATPPPDVGNLRGEECRASAKPADTTPFFDGYRDAYVDLAPVASFTPNLFGLFDMTGNLCEFCEDWWQNNWLTIMPSTDPVNLAPGKHKVVKGGAYDYPPDVSRIQWRNLWPPTSQVPDTGFRCAGPAP